MPLPFIAAWTVTDYLLAAGIGVGVYSAIFPPETLSKTITPEQLDQINAIIEAHKTEEEKAKEIYNLFGYSITWQTIIIIAIAIIIIYLILTR